MGNNGLKFFTALLLVANPKALIAAEARIITEQRAGMGTRLHIQIYSAREEEARAAIAAAFKEFTRLESLLSEWLPASEISRLNKQAGGDFIAISPESFTVLTRGKEISAASGGTFALSWAVLNDLWNFKTPLPLVPELSAVQRALPLINDENIELKHEMGASHRARLKRKGMRVGLGAIGKGYAADQIRHLIGKMGFDSVLIAAAGDIRVGSGKNGQAWKVGIQDPRASDHFAALPLHDEAISTSGDYERYFEKDGLRYSHILDPRTGLPASACRSVTVVAKNSMDADALATAIYVLGREKGADLAARMGVQTVIVDNANAVFVSAGLKERLHLLHPPTP